jgi:SAM-dependent methyltransferase
MNIPIYFEGAESYHHNFETFFETINYFGNKNIKILHLGAYSGHGTRWMLERVNGSCIDVDTWAGSTTEDGHLDSHEEFYDDRVEKMYDEQSAGLPTIKFKGTTAEFFAQNKEKFDFIYIDASHKKADVALDLEESFKILNHGGVIACDDYLWLLPGDPWNPPTEDYEAIPHEAINEFIEKNKDRIEILINNYQLWFKKVSV